MGVEQQHGAAGQDLDPGHRLADAGLRDDRVKRDPGRQLVNGLLAASSPRDAGSTEGYLASSDGEVVRREMAAQAATLTRQLTVLYPGEPEP